MLVAVRRAEPSVVEIVQRRGPSICLRILDEWYRSGRRCIGFEPCARVAERCRHSRCARGTVQRRGDPLMRQLQIRMPPFGAMLISPSHVVPFTRWPAFIHWAVGEYGAGHTSS